MTLGLIILICSILTSEGLYFGLGLTSMPEWMSWQYCWLPLAFFAAAFLLFDGIWAIFLLVGGKFINLKKKHEPNKFGMWILEQTAHQILFQLNVKVVTRGLEKLPKDQKYLGIFNHSSSWDALILLKHLDSIFISKKENLNGFLFGPWIEKSGSISIDNKNVFASLGSIKEAGAYLKNGVSNVLVSPEGTRSKKRELLPFHAVVFEAAKIGECPIAIFTLQNAQAITKRVIFRRTKVYLDLIDVIPFEEYKDMKVADLSDMCREKILNHLEENKDRLILKDGIE